MEGSHGPFPASTPLASDVNTTGHVSGRNSFGFENGAVYNDDSNAAVYTDETQQSSIPRRRSSKLSDAAQQPSIFQIRNQTKSSRLVRFSSDNSHIFNKVFDYSADDESASDNASDSDIGDDELFVDETSVVPTLYKSSSSVQTSLRQRVLMAIARTVYRSPPSSPLIGRGSNEKESIADDGSTREFQHSLSYTNLASLAQEKEEGERTQGESHPLLREKKINDNGSIPTRDESDSSSTKEQRNDQTSKKEKRAAKIAAAFLMDFENCRPCSLPEQVDFIRESQLRCHWLHFHPGWKVALYLAAISLFVASSFEGAGQTSSQMALFTFVPMGIFAIDILIRRHYRTVILPNGTSIKRSESSMSIASMSGHGSQRIESAELRSIVHTRKSRSRQWQWPLLVLFAALSFEMTVVSSRPIWSSAFKPIALFYISSNARDALEALQRVAPVVIKVIFMELFIILSFAAVATHTYTEFPSFDDLTTSFLSLFELSTTVVNPSIWMPIYDTRQSAGMFFILFIVTSVFYLHSLVLSVVFQTYIQAIREIRERSFSDREDAIRLAFITLEKINMNEEQSFPAVPTTSVRETLAILRPHYNQQKLNTLSQMLDPDDIGVVDYDTFRRKIPKALSTSLRTARRSTFVGGLVFELFAACFAIANLVYVLALSSSVEPLWWKHAEVWFGTCLTVVGLLEVLIRMNPAKLPFSVPTRFNRIFDSLALLAAAISGYGIFLHLTREPNQLHIEWLLAGRAVDMMRIMRFFGIFRSIVRRSGEVVPSISGPFILVFSTMHIFTYLGTALWHDAVEVGEHDGMITPYYDLNNFNSYSSGLVTMFQVLVVNDWHAIAEVYLYAKRCSDPAIVYSFFIGANLFSVSILLNVLTAFFVGAFVTSLDGNINEQKLSHRPTTKDMDNSTDPTSDFNVFERQGFDKIMETVAGDGGIGDDSNSWVKRTCEILEIFEGLTPGAEKVGHLVCCSQSEERFGNRRFLMMIKDFFGEDMMHMIVSDMHSELINALAAMESREKRNVQRVFDGVSKQLELSASLLSLRPPVSLFVARIRDYEISSGEEDVGFQMSS